MFKNRYAKYIDEGKIEEEIRLANAKNGSIGLSPKDEKKLRKKLYKNQVSLAKHNPNYRFTKLKWRFFVSLGVLITCVILLVILIKVFSR